MPVATSAAASAYDAGEATVSGDTPAAPPASSGRAADRAADAVAALVARVGGTGAEGSDDRGAGSTGVHRVSGGAADDGPAAVERVADEASSADAPGASVGGPPSAGLSLSDASPAHSPASPSSGSSGPVSPSAPAHGTGVPGARTPAVPSSLSPSRASDFMQCPLLYRFRVIDRLPEKPSEAATRGTLVHSVLERLFDAPAGERTVPRAKGLVPGQWERLREHRPEVAELFSDDPEGERLARWLGEAERLVERWFTLEDPTRLEPAERELFVEAELESGLTLRGIIDRVDVAPTGEVRIVDYKTGKAPRPEYAEGALFQMKFYALVVWRLKNVVPRRLQLVYLGSGDVVTYDPVPADLERVERKLLALWEAISEATRTGDWRPRPTKLCGWCDHQLHCPEFGGTPPPYPLPAP
ncbi:DUF2800 domain-containing protein [Streptomyces sp. ST1015]|nr:MULTISPECIES: RecB family exonuclease [unclassified Streptomyces]QZZ32635.1 DUF2800 domain-containing protein [Streptomyces sp. ST1015]